MLHVYGHYVGQPSRAVLWLLKINKIPFEFTKVEALLGATRTKEFSSMFPTERIPAIEDVTTKGTFRLAESAAIMKYLCEKHKLESWYPLKEDEYEQRAKVFEYLMFHAETRRLSTLLAFPLFGWKIRQVPWPAEQRKAALMEAHGILQRFERVFLTVPNSPYINGFQTPTIADLSAYTEIGQLQQLKLMHFNELEFPHLSRWLVRMQALPFHDDVHRSVIRIANIPST